VHYDWNLVTGYGSQRVLKLSGRSEILRIFMEFGGFDLSGNGPEARVQRLAGQTFRDRGVVVMKTGEVVWHFGLYSSECCTSEIELKKLQVFPSCPACRDRTVWDCVETEVAVLSLAA
jgi:hypothetical protein